MKYSEAVDHYMTQDGTLTERAEFFVRLGIGVMGEAVSKTAHAHGWWENGTRNMGEMLMLMTSELSEALESYRNSEPNLWYRYPNNVKSDEPSLEDRQVYQDGDGATILGKPEGVAAELADCVIRILDTCQTLEIPVVQALLDKHRYNITRPYRHGGKAC